MKRRRLNEDFMSTLSSGIRSLLDIPLVKTAVKAVGIGDEPGDKDLGQIFTDLTQEMIPLKDALAADTDKRALVAGSSQAGLIGQFVMNGMESRGFKSFNFGSAPIRSMRLIYASIATSIRDRDEYDVVVIFAGYRSGDTADSVADMIDLFTPARCFIVLPPPVTTITDTLAASRGGINRGKPVVPDYWFKIDGGNYARDREAFSNELASIVTKAGATPIDPRNVVAGGDMQPSGVAFPNSPDGIHAADAVNRQIADAIVEAIFSCELPVPATQVAKKIKPEDLKRNPGLVQQFSKYPALSGLLGASVSSKFGQRVNPVTHNLSTHEGIDISVPVGTPVKAALGGTVTLTRMGSESAGNYVEITHDSGDVTRYLHLDKILVNKGQTVSSGETVGLSGATGHATGPHLHWETWVGGGKGTGGTAIDPFEWLQDNPDAVEPIRTA